jgi:Skp family chaperone for outer membrane proteins
MKISSVTHHLFRLAMLVTVVALLLANCGCKSKKKAMEAAKATTEQEEALRKQREEEARKREAEEMARKEAEAKRESELKKTVSTNTHYVKLEQYFNAITAAPSVASANGSINEALSLFSSDQTPVLIVIS